MLLRDCCVHLYIVTLQSKVSKRLKQVSADQAFLPGSFYTKMTLHILLQNMKSKTVCHILMSHHSKMYVYVVLHVCMIIFHQ